MKANFKYNHEKAIDICLEYSDDPNTLKKVIKKISGHLNVFREAPTNSRWDKKLRCLPYEVALFDHTFTFYGSHNDAEAFGNVDPWAEWREKHILRKRRLEINDSFLYSILCCIKSDLYCLHEDPEDIGFDSDSIKDMAKWNELREHARKLQQAIKLSLKEMNSLPS